MITGPFVILAIAGGALSALGGFLFRKVFQQHNDNVAKIAALETRQPPITTKEI